MMELVFVFITIKQQKTVASMTVDLLNAALLIAIACLKIR